MGHQSAPYQRPFLKQSFGPSTSPKLPGVTDTPETDIAAPPQTPVTPLIQQPPSPYLASGGPQLAQGLAPNKKKLPFYGSY